MALPNKIRIREVGPREGFQIIPEIIATNVKVSLINKLSESGLKEIEVASFVRPDLVPQMADASQVIAQISKNSNVKYTALYLNQEGFKRAEETKLLQNEGWIHAACSETFLKKNSNTSLDKIIANLKSWIDLFKSSGKNLHGLMLSTAFGCNYEGEITTAKLISTISKIQEAALAEGSGFKEICLADTVGRGHPLSVQEGIEALHDSYPEIYISLHLHDTRGTGLANAFAAMELGIDCFDSSIGGIGGCPFSKGASGNIATEDLVHMCDSMGIETSVNLQSLIETAYYLETEAGIKIHSKCPAALKNLNK